MNRNFKNLAEESFSIIQFIRARLADAPTELINDLKKIEVEARQIFGRSAKSPFSEDIFPRIKEEILRVKNLASNLESGGPKKAIAARELLLEIDQMLSEIDTIFSGFGARSESKNAY